MKCLKYLIILLLVSFFNVFCFKQPAAPAAKILISKLQLEVDDKSKIDTFQIYLTTQPSDTVYIGLYTNNTQIIKIDTQELVFTSSDYSPKQITVTGLEYLGSNNDEQFEIIILPSQSTDKAYNNIDLENVIGINKKVLAPISFQLLPPDNDSLELVTPFILSEAELIPRYYKIKLSREPGLNPVQILIDSSSCNTLNNLGNVSVSLVERVGSNATFNVALNGYLLTLPANSIEATLSVIALQDGRKESPQQSCTLSHSLVNDTSVLNLNLILLDRDSIILQASSFPTSIREATRQTYWLSFTTPPVNATYTLQIEKQVPALDNYIYIHKLNISRTGMVSVSADDEKAACLNQDNSREQANVNVATGMISNYTINVGGTTYNISATSILDSTSTNMPISSTQNGVCLIINTKVSPEAIPNNLFTSSIVHKITNCTNPAVGSSCPNTNELRAYGITYRINFVDRDRAGLFISLLQNTLSSLDFYHFYDQTLTYYVKLTSRPTGNVTVTMSSADPLYNNKIQFALGGGAFNTSQLPLTFDQADWNTVKTIQFRYTDTFSFNTHESYNIKYEVQSNVDPLYHTNTIGVINRSFKTFFSGLEFKTASTNLNFNIDRATNATVLAVNLVEGDATSMFEYSLKNYRTPVIEPARVDLSLRNLDGTNSSISLTRENCTTNTNITNLSFSGTETPCIRLKLPASSINANTNLRFCHTLAGGSFITKTTFLDMYDKSFIPISLVPVYSTATPVFYCFPICLRDSSSSGMGCN